MCLAVPMRIRQIDGFDAVCEAGGIEREVNLFLLQDDKPAPGDCVLVHVGYAIRKVTETDMARAWEVLAEIGADDA